MNKTLFEFQKIIQDLFDQFSSALPTILGALVLIIVGWILGKFFAFIVKRVLLTLKVDDHAEKLRQVDMFQNMDIKFSKMASQLVFWIIMLFFLIAGFEFLGLETVSGGIYKIVAYIPKLLTAVMFFIIGVLFANIIKGVVAAACASMNINAGRFISAFVFYFLVIMVSISALNQAGIETSIITQNITIGMAAIFFAFAIGYGFASKDIMANLLASFYSKDKFTLGQHIRVDGIEGKIVNLDSTSVTLDGGDRQVIIPLHKLVSTTVELMD